jgi:hypothetical protein
MGYGLTPGHQAVVWTGGGDAVHNGIVEGNAGGEVSEASGRRGEVRVHEALDFVPIAAYIVQIDYAHALLWLRLQEYLKTACQQHHRGRPFGQTRFCDPNSNQFNSHTLLREVCFIVAGAGAAARECCGDVAHGDGGEHAVAIDSVGSVAAGGASNGKEE